MDEVVRPWRGVAAEDRRAQRREQLLRACLEVVGESGVDDTTIDAVVRTAGLSKRYFYESFANRDEVLVATFDELMARIRDRLSVVLHEEAAPEERIRRTVEALARALAEDDRASRLFVEAGRVAAVERRRHEAFLGFSQLLVEGIYDAADDPRVAATALFVVAGTTEVLARWLTALLPLDEAEVVELITSIGVRLRGAAS